MRPEKHSKIFKKEIRCKNVDPKQHSPMTSTIHSRQFHVDQPKSVKTGRHKTLGVECMTKSSRPKKKVHQRTSSEESRPKPIHQPKSTNQSRPIKVDQPHSHHSNSTNQSRPKIVHQSKSTNHTVDHSKPTKNPPVTYGWSGVHRQGVMHHGDRHQAPWCESCQASPLNSSTLCVNIHTLRTAVLYC